jgi:hypothetical protein
MKSNSTVVFTQSVVERCTEIGWSQGTQNITQFTNQDGQAISLPTEYGRIDMATLTTQCERFMEPTGADYNNSRGGTGKQVKFPNISDSS